MTGNRLSIRSHIRSDVLGDNVGTDTPPFAVPALVFIRVATLFDHAAECFEGHPRMNKGDITKQSDLDVRALKIRERSRFGDHFKECLAIVNIKVR